jgi:hypothetical protein
MWCVGAWPCAAPLAAQRETTTGPPPLPRDVRREAVDRWNGPNALRASDRLEIEAAQEVGGNVAVQHGPLVIAGHVTGSVLALNASVVLRSTARVDGTLLVIGGRLEGADSARVAGGVRTFLDSLVYRQDGERIVAITSGEGDEDSWWRRLERQHDGSFTKVVRIVQAGAYNRVEGLPISLGPVVHRLTPWGSVDAGASAIVRTGSFESENGDVGHDLRSEVRFGRERGVGIGGRVFSVVDPVEDWQLSSVETALAAFLVRRDYRDYFQRHGATAIATLYGGGKVRLTGTYGEERWDSRVLRNPFTLFNDASDWRPNPEVDAGVFHIGTLALTLDTRTDADDPWSGWLAMANVEHGTGTPTAMGPTSTTRVIGSDPVGYTRAFIDLRRYNRLGPSEQLNLRLLFGGRLGGDQLPLERRLSVDGPGALPGYDFRSSRPGVDVGECSEGPPVLARPAECERIVLAQVEYRGDLRLDFTGRWENWPRNYHSEHGEVAYVVFADAGRGWLVGPSNGTAADPGLTYASTTLPALSTFRTDVGVGLDVAGIGVYAAKSLTTPTEGVNFFFRLRHRF